LAASSRAAAALLAALGVAAWAPTVRAELTWGGDVQLAVSNAVRGGGSELNFLPVASARVGVVVGPIDAGLRLGLSHEMLFGYTKSAVGPYVAFSAIRDRYKTALVIEGGAHTFFGVGGGVDYEDVVSPSPTLPFVGALARFQAIVARSLALGGVLSIDRDLGTRDFVVSRRHDTCVIDCAPLEIPLSQDPYSVGGWTVGVGFTVDYTTHRR
jgi:hypothetical protein